MPKPPAKTLYVFGNGNLSLERFQSDYLPHLQALHPKRDRVLVGDFRGVDTLTMEALKCRTSKVTVFHVGATPRYLPDRYRTKVGAWTLRGGFGSDRARDDAAIAECTHFLGFDHNSDAHRTSGSHQNIERCLALGRTRLGVPDPPVSTDAPSAEAHPPGAPSPIYDTIGQGYRDHRQPDPLLEARIRAALGPARTVVNVGAGSGSYEPRGRLVLPIEPSAVMARQRPPGSPAIRGVAQDLPLHDQSVDAALAILSLHHWHPDAQRGVAELCRVARDAVVVVTVDPAVCGQMWLLADYLHAVRELDHRIFPAPDTIAGWMDRPTRVEVIPIARDTPDHTLMSYWAHPERVFDPAARQATSGFAKQPAEVVDQVVQRLRADLDTGRWDARHGHLRSLDSYDAGLRLIVGRREGQV